MEIGVRAKSQRDTLLYRTRQGRMQAIVVSCYNLQPTIKKKYRKSNARVEFVPCFTFFKIDRKGCT